MGGDTYLQFHIRIEVITNHKSIGNGATPISPSKTTIISALGLTALVGMMKGKWHTPSKIGLNVNR